MLVLPVNPITHISTSFYLCPILKNRCSSDAVWIWSTIRWGCRLVSSILPITYSTRFYLSYNFTNPNLPPFLNVKIISGGYGGAARTGGGGGGDDGPPNGGYSNAAQMQQAYSYNAAAMAG